MPVSQNKIVSAQGVVTAHKATTAAKITYTDIANAQLILTAGINGGVLYGAKAVPQGSVALTQCMLLSDDGTTVAPFSYAVLTAYTLATTTLPPTADFAYSESAPRRLAPGEKIYGATAVANAAGVAFDLQYENL